MQFWRAYIISFLVIAAVAFLPMRVTQDAIKSKWYDCIRPSLSPPNHFFPIVWTFLYILLTISFARTLLRVRGGEEKMRIYGFHFLFSVLWSFSFFGAHNPILSFFVLIGMLFTLYSIFEPLLYPYAFWLCFALILNIQTIYNSITRMCET